MRLFGILEYLSRTAGFSDLSISSKPYFVGDLPGKSHFMGRHHEVNPLVLKLSNHVQDLARHFRIQGGGRFIQEKKLRAMEDNLFVMKEFVNEKGAETNIGPIKDEVRGLGYEINQMLISLQQKAA